MVLREQQQPNQPYPSYQGIIMSASMYLKGPRLSLETYVIMKVTRPREGEEVKLTY